MASVFLSYDRDDTAAAKVIATALERSGHSVWWDLHVRGGAQFSKVIEEALKAADFVVVLWSAYSVESAWVRDEAAAGRDSGRLIPATIDGTKAPMGFRQYQTIALTDWKRGARGRGYKELRQAIEEVSGQPSPMTGPTSEGRAASRRIAHWWAAIPIAAAVVAAAYLAWPTSSSAVPTVAVLPASTSVTSKDLAGDLFAKLGSLWSARTDAVRLTGPSGAARQADFVFEAGGDDNTKFPSANITLLAGKDRTLLWSKDFQAQNSNRTALEQSMAYTAGQVLDCAVQASAASARLDEQTLKLFLNGCALYAERYFSDSSSVVPIFERIVAAAPKFQPAWAKLLLAEGQTTRAQGLYYGRFAPGRLPEHIDAVSKLNPRLPELYIAKAALQPLYARDERFRLLNEAIRLGPDDPNAYLTRSFEDDQIGRNNDAIEDTRRAVELDPLAPSFESSLIQTLAYSGQIAAADQELRRAEQLWPGTPTIEDARFRFTSRFGDAREALQMLHSAGFKQMYPTAEMEAYLLARLEPNEANISRAISAAQSPQLPEPRRIAQTVQLLGDFGREHELYVLLANLSPAQLAIATGVIFRPSLHKFREDPRFIQLVSRVGLVDFWRRSGKWPDFCFEPDLPYDCKKEAAKLKA